MSVFSSSITHRSYYWQISALCFVLGLLLAAAGHTVSQIRQTGGNSVRNSFFAGTVEATAQRKAAEYEAEINKQRGKIEDLEKEKSKGTDAEKRLTGELEDARMMAGLTEVVGPGVRITLLDSAKKPLTGIDVLEQRNLVHDFQISAVVNELKAADAEAVAVNGQRIISRSAVRCVGPIVHINHVAASPPFVIEAIGDPETLLGAMNIVGGVLEDVKRFDPAMVKIEKRTKLHLPAYAGGTQMRYGRAPETKPDKEKKSGKTDKTEKDGKAHENADAKKDNGTNE